MIKLKGFFIYFLIIFGFFLLTEGISIIFYRPLEYKKEINERNIPQKDDLYLRHKELGWILIPGYKGHPECLKKVKNNQSEYYEINSQGIRDREYTFQKPKDVVRIFCLGDSITMGPTIDNENTYPKALERYLNSIAISSKRYETINGGIGDYNTYQEFMLLKEIGLKYNPDIVILQYYPNDGRKYVSPKKLFLEEGLDMAYSKSAFVYFLDRGIRRIMIAIMKKQWGKDRERWKPRYSENKWLNDKTEVDALIELADKDWGVAWKDTGWQEAKKQLDQIVAFSKEKGFKLVIVYTPHKIQIVGAGSLKYDLQKPEKDIEKYCIDNGIVLISLTQSIKENMNKNIDNIIFDYCHYTAYGAEVVAKYIGDSLIKLKIIN